MTIIGLDSNHTPFKYLDQFITPPDWTALHNEVSAGIARSEWCKKFVSSGVHKNWAEKEVATVFLDLKNRLTKEQLAIFQTLEETDEKIKFINALTYQPHPFWLLYLRLNNKVEKTRVANKAVAADCYWTENTKYFPQLVKFIESMPFESIGRVMFFMTEANNQTVPHFDAANQDQRLSKPHDDFIWFTTKPASKSVFVMDGDSLEKHYPDPANRFIWFNEMDFHGTDPVAHFSFSIRIDGKFKPHIRSQITDN